KNAPPLSSHVFQANATTFELIKNIIETNLLNKFHEDWTIHVTSRVKNAPPPGGHKSNQTNLRTKFHEDWTINVARATDKLPLNVASRELTRQMLTPHNGRRTTDKRQSQKLTMSTCSDIIGTNLLTKFHQDRKINVASRVLTRKNAPPPGSHVFQPTGIIF
ncbi:hypothetical protein DPMN_039372, partial [Dreissena polymorpha]